LVKAKGIDNCVMVQHGSAVRLGACGRGYRRASTRYINLMYAREVDLSEEMGDCRERYEDDFDREIKKPISYMKGNIPLEVTS
jgi:hypothetical protein